MSAAADAIRASYEALNRGDVEATFEALDPGVHWRESGALPDATEFHGRDAVRDFLAHWLDSWESFHQEIEEVVERGERVGVFVRLRARGRGSGVDVETRYAHVWTVRDGRGVRVDAFYDPDEARAALGIA